MLKWALGGMASFFFWESLGLKIEQNLSLKFPPVLFSRWMTYSPFMLKKIDIHEKILG